MITINFFKDGAYIKGHDINEICTLVSYAMWSCINDCFEEDRDLYYYESSNDDQWSDLGFSYIKINYDSKEHLKILNRFQTNISEWLDKLHHNRVKIIYNLNDEIVWEQALLDAKKEQGFVK